MSGEAVELESGLRLTVDEPESATASPILLLPAMGVPARFYGRFVAGLVARGHTVVRLHWRDEDRDFPLDNPDFGYADLAEVDLPEAAEWFRARFDVDPVVVGHSLGGQIASISAAAAGPYRAMALIASGTNYYRGSGLRWAAGVGFVSAVVVPVSVKLFGYWPGGRFGFGGRQSATLISDWARLGRTGRFEPAHAETDLEGGLRELAIPVLALTVQGDQYVSPGATDQLLDKLTSARIERRHWRTDEHDYRGHFNWAKAVDGPAGLTHEWIASVS